MSTFSLCVCRLCLRVRSQVSEVRNSSRHCMGCAKSVYEYKACVDWIWVCLLIGEPVECSVDWNTSLCSTLFCNGVDVAHEKSAYVTYVVYVCFLPFGLCRWSTTSRCRWRSRRGCCKGNCTLFSMNTSVGVFFLRTTGGTHLSVTTLSCHSLQMWCDERKIMVHMCSLKLLRNPQIPTCAVQCWYINETYTGDCCLHQNQQDKTAPWVIWQGSRCWPISCTGSLGCRRDVQYLARQCFF